MLNKYRRNKRNKYQHGGEVKVDFPMPEVQHGTTQDALKSNVDETKKANAEQVALNKSGGGDDIVVPQLGSAAGDAGNDEIANQIGVLNQGNADTEFDKEAPVVPKAKQGGGLSEAEIQKLKEKLRKQVVTTPGKFSLASTKPFKDVGGIARERDYNVPEMVVGGCGCDKGGKRRKTRKKTRKRTRKKKGGHCQKQLKKVRILLKQTKKNKTKRNIKKLKKHMKILTRKIKEYNNPKKKLRKNKSHIKRYRKIKSQFKRLI